MYIVVGKVGLTRFIREKNMKSKTWPQCILPEFVRAELVPPSQCPSWFAGMLPLLFVLVSGHLILSLSHVPSVHLFL